ncbi:hypothetical protein SteCoe_15109 [Stentor coeruleus]|uniref:Uncharacterized protein n=1 Tax=Stentor coeruleus TaxID=5963 RepID=A0A1R2C4I1_9CILI|nr:hypothetical protein SteCoe_15109 [Stentor coeruleus]
MSIDLQIMAEKTSSSIQLSEPKDISLETDSQEPNGIDLDPDALSPWPVTCDDFKAITEGHRDLQIVPQSASTTQKPSGTKKYKVRWTKEEDELLYKYYLEHGKNWKKISELIKGKSCYLVKKRFYDIVYEGNNYHDYLEAGYFSKRKNRVFDSLTDKQKHQKVKQLYSRMINLQKFINDSKQKLYFYAEQNYPIK